jgi:uncharacterized protein YceK
MVKIVRRTCGPLVPAALGVAGAMIGSRQCWIVATVALLLSGCATTWSRPDTSAQQRSQDKSACSQQALHEWPQIAKPAPRSFPACTPLSNQTVCSNVPQTAPRSTLPRDANEKPREEAFNACMRARGYTQPLR